MSEDDLLTERVVEGYYLHLRVAHRFMQGNLFDVGDIILFGKYKNKKGRIVSFGRDHKGNPTVEIEPIPKGRKENKTFGLFKIWKSPGTPEPTPG